ncbi:hypothetical protein INS49_015064 [Diaporthe citri]|uniref:uncharacterized protein n=1 Tax=Diaporthe citri TaxID=83186 RepID=UPI001C7E2720|nr:uncharacterized protein INS49_015064 [Diaporthe citri]KAG6357186.1 hypothetical protein INS49_015064 [Diaporthe citri]
MSATVGDSGKAIALQQMQNTLGPTSLFRLPPELRLMIWKFLLPGRRVFKARSSGAHMDPRRSDDRRFVFGFDSKVSQPILSQICAESRQCLLDYGHGQFIFGLEGEAGLWWGPEDVLLFDQDWCLGWSTPSLEGLKALDRVKNIALDSVQALYIYYEYALPEADETYQDGSEDSDQESYHEDEDGQATDSDTEPTAAEPFLPQRITLGCWSCSEKPHFLEYFTALNELTIVFERTMRPFCGDSRLYHLVSAVGDWPISQFLDSVCPYDRVTFVRDSTSMDEAVQKMSKFRRLWMQTADTHRWSHCEYGRTFNTAHVLYDFCIDRSRTESPDAPYIVTSFNMMDNEHWAI